MENFKTDIKIIYCVNYLLSAAKLWRMEVIKESKHYYYFKPKYGKGLNKAAKKMSFVKYFVGKENAEKFLESCLTQ